VVDCDFLVVVRVDKGVERVVDEVLVWVDLMFVRVDLDKVDVFTFSFVVVDEILLVEVRVKVAERVAVVVVLVPFAVVVVLGPFAVVVVLVRLEVVLEYNSRSRHAFFSASQ
jgi:hypothetical protein